MPKAKAKRRITAKAKRTPTPPPVEPTQRSTSVDPATGQEADPNRVDVGPRIHAGALLQESIAAHLAYRDAVRRKDATRATAQLILAQAKRAEAHTVDPEHTDPAWATTAKTHPHDSLTLFYREQLAR